MEFSAESLLKEAKTFHLKKSLGQHFLIRPEALSCAVDALAITADDTVIEVGPGLGFLTRPLSKAGAHVIAVDLDRESIARLMKMSLPGVELRHGDFLQFDLNDLQFYEGKNARENEGSFATKTSARNEQTAKASLKVAGNVPYQITGLILGHVLGEIDSPAAWLGRIKVIVLTVQKEVAQRMVAKAASPHYSKLSLLIEYFCEAEIAMNLQPKDFYPPPQVSSSIVKMVPRARPPVAPKNVRLLKQIIDAGFRQRRKTLPNALSFLRIAPKDLQNVFKRLSFDPQTRAERLSLQQFAMLADAIHDYLTMHAPNSSARPSES
jgi:16S rRNA (adenine1518-N6/adenine1519-N6)-dimethyltransferase